MGTIAARTLDSIHINVEGTLACELLCALAATDFRRPLRNGAGTAIAYERARERIAPLAADRVFARDIEAARELIRSNALDLGDIDPSTA
jgi:histidine ammonia-lyase